MDEATFKSDTVLSDVHLYTPNQRHLMVRLNSTGQPGKVLVCVEGPSTLWIPFCFLILIFGGKIGKTGLTVTVSPLLKYLSFVSKLLY